MLEDYLKKFLEIISKYKKQRPQPERNFDQFFCTEETAIKRANLINSLPQIENKNLLFLGDDDLTSIAFCLSFKAKKIMVVDIDKRILNFIKIVAEKENLPIEIYEHDLRNPLPKNEFKNYDVVFFDPPYTPEAVNTFLLRAIEASLGSGSNFKRKKPEFLSQKFYLMSYGYTERETEKGLKIQEIITSLGLIIQEKFRSFNRYYGAESIGSKSDLYILQPTPRVNLKKLDSFRSQFYTGQRSSSSNEF